MSDKPRVLLTPKGDTGLVWTEAITAFARDGVTVHAVMPEDLTPEYVAKLYALPPGRAGLTHWPDLFFCVNFAGLDKHGETFAALRANGVPVAVWCVDNPWNLLSGLRSDFWKDAYLFVTDAAFIPTLKAHGAKHAYHLPLATDTTVFAPPASANAAAETPVVFVGRSAFPDKERFFVGQSVPEDIQNEALTRAANGHRPDFFWWLEHLGFTADKVPLWPGSAARKASLGAETASRAWRAACLRASAKVGLTVYGDAHWQGLLPEGTANVRPPVDYYTGLAAIYASAPYSLAVTSLLLPQGLNQRHFDVWAAGGFCVTDDTPGLALFPNELTEGVVFRKAEDIPDIVGYFEKNPEEKKRLAAAWRAHVVAEHTYERRVRRLVEGIF